MPLITRWTYLRLHDSHRDTSELPPTRYYAEEEETGQRSTLCCKRHCDSSYELELRDGRCKSVGCSLKRSQLRLDDFPFSAVSGFSPFSLPWHFLPPSSCAGKPRCCTGHLRGNAKQVKRSAQRRSFTNPPYTAWESERNPHGAHREPTGNPAGTCMAEREEPTRSLREPTAHRNPPQTVSKTAQEPTSHPLVFIILFIRGKGDAVGNIETLASIIQRLFL